MLFLLLLLNHYCYIALKKNQSFKIIQYILKKKANSLFLSLHFSTNSKTKKLFSFYSTNGVSGFLSSPVSQLNQENAAALNHQENYDQNIAHLSTIATNHHHHHNSALCCSFANNNNNNNNNLNDESVVVRNVGGLVDDYRLIKSSEKQFDEEIYSPNDPRLIESDSYLISKNQTTATNQDPVKPKSASIKHLSSQLDWININNSFNSNESQPNQQLKESSSKKRKKSSPSNLLKQLSIKHMNTLDLNTNTNHSSEEATPYVIRRKFSMGSIKVSQNSNHYYYY